MGDRINMSIFVDSPLDENCACFVVEGFNTLVSTVGLNLPDKRVDPGCWLRSGYESPRSQLGF